MPSKKVIKLILLSLFLLIAGGVKAFSFELFQFSVAPKYGLQYGQMNEYVLYTNGNTQSELIWQIEKMNLLGFNATMGWELLFLETNCMWGFPADSGQLLDSDWQNNKNYSMKTNYSISENSVDYFGDIDLRVGLNIKTWNFLFLKPYVGIAYNRINFSAKNGYGAYGDASNSSDRKNHNWYDEEARKISKGNLCEIAYEREQFVVDIGLKTDFKFLSRFILKFDFSISLFSQINTIDTHYADTAKSKSIKYLDKMQGAFKTVNIGAELDVSVWKGFSAGTSFKFVKINQTLGNDYRKDLNYKTYKPDTGVIAAASGYSYNIEFFVRYSF